MVKTQETSTFQPYGRVSWKVAFRMQGKKTYKKMVRDLPSQRELMLILKKNCPAINERRRVGYIRARWRTNCKLVYYEKAPGDDKLLM